ncbi:YheC/YheD family protein [Salipaludibacillus sp. CF4.18]|uniref:YheC/YheD family endospore coat-associated protein n=1 Tax=Salipaludibacillus sp. CF4.18 TaxID=3373081 RepID=UPI003EE5D7F8
MLKKIKIKWIHSKNNDDIHLPIYNTFESKLTSQEIDFQFGSWNKKMTVFYDKNLPSNTIGLSKDLQKQLFIPDNLTFEIKITNNTLNVGPTILWIAANTNERLGKRLKNLQKRIEAFVPVKGMICVCAEEGINTNTGEIQGYYFQSHLRCKDLKWKKATFFSPGAIFKRVPLADKTNKYLCEITKGRMFNSYFFNKWEMWQWLSSDSILKKHLPFTKKVNSMEEIKEMLVTYPSVYLKPVKGSEGKKIIQLERDGSLYHVTDDKKDKKSVTHLKDHTLLVKRLKSSNRYLVQQGVPTKYQSRNVDFRIYMQRNEMHQWKSSGITARISQPGSIVTNIRHLDYWMTGRDALKKIYKLDKKSTYSQVMKINSICTRACEKLDINGNYGDIAIDFIVDKNLHVWILEMNLRHVFPVEDPGLAPKVKRMPFLYAMSIAGFPRKKKKRRKNKSR